MYLFVYSFIYLMYLSIYFSLLICILLLLSGVIRIVYKLYAYIKYPDAFITNYGISLY